MKTGLILLVASVLLTGCAGMNGDFDCNKSAVDNCLTMDAANKMAASGKSLNEVGVTTGKKPTVPAVTTSVVRKAVPCKPSIKKVAAAPFINDAGMVDAFRVPDGVQVVWIAPFVDTDEVFHQPQIVEFVKTPAYWRSDSVIKGAQ